MRTPSRRPRVLNLLLRGGLVAVAVQSVATILDGLLAGPRFF